VKLSLQDDLKVTSIAVKYSNKTVLKIIPFAIFPPPGKAQPSIDVRYDGSVGRWRSVRQFWISPLTITWREDETISAR